MFFLLSLAVVSFTDIGVIQGWSRWMHQLLLVHSNSPVKLVNNWESFHERNERSLSTRLSIPVDPKTAQSKCSSFAKLSLRFCVVLRSRNVFWTAMLPGAAQMVNLCFQICTWTFSVSFFWSNKIWRFFRAMVVSFSQLGSTKLWENCETDMASRGSWGSIVFGWLPWNSGDPLRAVFVGALASHGPSTGEVASAGKKRSRVTGWFHTTSPNLSSNFPLTWWTSCSGSRTSTARSRAAGCRFAARPGEAEKMGMGNRVARLVSWLWPQYTPFISRLEPIY